MWAVRYVITPRDASADAERKIKNPAVILNAAFGGFATKAE